MYIDVFQTESSLFNTDIPHIVVARDNCLLQERGDTTCLCCYVRRGHGFGRLFFLYALLAHL